MLGEHRLLCGDATVPGDVERVLDGQLADMTFTDPPYNVDYGSSAKDKLRGNRRKILNDDLGGTFPEHRSRAAAVRASAERALAPRWSSGLRASFSRKTGEVRRAMLYLTNPKPALSLGVTRSYAMASVLTAPHFHDEAAAYEFVEARVWPNGPFCPHCGEAERILPDNPEPGKEGPASGCISAALPEQFTVKVGTVSSAAMFRCMLASGHAHYVFFQKGYQLSPAPPHPRGDLQNGLVHQPSDPRSDARRLPEPVGGKGKFVEVDETYIGRVRGMRKTRGPSHKMKVLSSSSAAAMAGPSGRVRLSRPPSK